MKHLDHFELVPLDDRALCDAAGGPSLADLVTALKSPVARSNLIRTSLVFRDGGVYLDMDTLTVRSFEDVRATAPGFLGEEDIVFPEKVVSSWDPRVKARAYLMTTIRDMYRRLPRGYRYFPRIERYCHREVNGAVMGGVQQHPFYGAYLSAMAQVPKARWHKPHAFGTHLLQVVYKAYAGDDLHAFPPPYFYPLPPEISQHWFRLHRDGVDPLEVIEPQTCCVHWYASVRTKKVVRTVDEAELRRLASQQLFANLAVRVLDGEVIRR